MRIIDSNQDFYDYYQGIIKDDRFTFDRRGSHNLTRGEIAGSFRWDVPRNKHNEFDPKGYMLLQVCNTLWLFRLIPTQLDDLGYCCADYTLELISNWKDYDVPRKCIELAHVKFKGLWSHMFWNKKEPGAEFFENAIHTNDYTVERVLHSTWHDDGKYPILKDIGITAFVNPQDMYLSLEEYFAMEKTASERTEAVGTTNNDKITNHGFDLKTSFRGKNKREE